MPKERNHDPIESVERRRIVAALKVIRTTSELRAWRASQGRVGLVPTMGALHEGHRSLVARAVAEQEATLVSIFVNPTQFGPGEDYAAYPRREAEDVTLLERAGVAAVFAPGASEIYPPGDSTRIDPGPIAARLEGAVRPGHFIGVATVVVKLMRLATPDVAYFGQKDFQQLRVIQHVRRELGLKTRIAGCPTVRDEDGLALSSRNAYLTAAERGRAQALSRGLFLAQGAWSSGEREPARLRALVEETAMQAGPLDYVSVADPFTLDELDRPAERVVILLAARVGRARLIDNVLLGMDLAELG